jgi:hypothetical protein
MGISGPQNEVGHGLLTKRGIVKTTGGLVKQQASISINYVYVQPTQLIIPTNCRDRECEDRDKSERSVMTGPTLSKFTRSLMRLRRKELYNIPRRS